MNLIRFSFAAFLLLLISFPALAIESESQRESIITPRSKRFYNPGKKSREYLAFGGIYSSDYNSKKYQLNSRYLFQSDKHVNEMNFEHETEYADRGSGANKQAGVKISELYDLSLSGKIRFEDSKNYSVLYHRSIYDKLADYTYDGRVAVGLGRIFFNGKLEWDASLSHHEVKELGNEIDFITSWRARFKITDNLRFVQRAYLFINSNSMDNQFRTSLVYRVKNNLSFTIRHNFEQRRYEEEFQNNTKNLVNRSITVGIIFDLN